MRFNAERGEPEMQAQNIAESVRGAKLPAKQAEPATV
jgi:hypothetical protein